MYIVKDTCEILFVLLSVAADVMTVKLSLEDLENTASSMEHRGIPSKLHLMTFFATKTL